MSTFFENILLKTCEEKNKKSALLGDYNIDLLNIENDEKISDFYNLLTAFGFRPLILQASRIQTTSRSTSATLIDNIFVNGFDNMSIGGNITTSISDHYPQFSVIEIFFTVSHKSKNVCSFGRSFKNFNQNEFESELKSVNWNHHFENKNSDQCLNFFNNKVECLLN